MCIPNFLSPSVPIVYHFWQLLQTVSNVLAGRPTLVYQCVGVHKRMSLMSLSLFFQQCPTWLIHLWWFLRWEVGGRRAAFYGAGVDFGICLKKSSKHSCVVPIYLFLYVQVVHPYSSRNTATARKKFRFILSDQISIWLITCR